MQRKKSGMEQLATGTKVIVRRTRRASSPTDLRNEEAVRMSMFPGGAPLKPNELTKIEREDWPGPASPAAMLPELSKFENFTFLYNCGLNGLIDLHKITLMNEFALFNDEFYLARDSGCIMNFDILMCSYITN